jgi:hypothetical protein
MPKTLAANLVTFGRAATTVPAAPGSGKRFLVRAHRSPPGASGTAGPPADAMYPDEPAARTFTGISVPALSGRAICAARHTPVAPQLSCTIADLACRRSGGAVPPPFPAGAAARPSLRSWPSRPVLSRGGLRMPSRRPQDDTHTTDKEQNPLVTDRERSTARDRCRHMPPQLGCARSTTGVQSSREESQSRLHADKRAHLPASDATPSPQEGQLR